MTDHLIPNPLPPALEAWVERHLPGPLAASLAEADEGSWLLRNTFHPREHNHLVRLTRVTPARLWVKDTSYNRSDGRERGVKGNAWHVAPRLEAVTPEQARRLLLERRHRELVAWANGHEWNEVPLDVLQRVADVVLR